MWNRLFSNGLILLWIFYGFGVAVLCFTVGTLTGQIWSAPESSTEEGRILVSMGLRLGVLVSTLGAHIRYLLIQPREHNTPKT